MNFILENLSLETTRRCNSRCNHCMRGPSQNIDLTKDIVDSLLDNNSINYIGELIFSGGEPTLNSEIIIYTLNKLMSKKIYVEYMTIVTNGQIFNLELIEAFNQFNDYLNDLNCGIVLYHIDIVFSNDQFHATFNPDVEKKYRVYAKGIHFTHTGLIDESQIHKTGYATFGKKFNYQLEDIRYWKLGLDDDEVEIMPAEIILTSNDVWVRSVLYITANGYITTTGDGAYVDMDNMNMGHISNARIEELLIKYGKPIRASLTNDNDNNSLVKKLSI